MIVLSILTALALERAAVSLHDRSAAQESRARIEAEIAGNLSDLKSSAVNNAANAQKVDQVLKSLIASKQIAQSQQDLIALIATGHAPRPPPSP